jgi:hypothetical protein
MPEELWKKYLYLLRLFSESFPEQFSTFNLTHMETTGTLGNYIEIKDQKIELEGDTLLHLNEIRKWTHFLSILGFVAVGLVLFVGVLLLIASSFRSSFQYDPLGSYGPLIGIFYIVFSGIYFFPVFYLYKFSRYAKQSMIRIGSEGPSNELMAHAIDYMKKHFRFVGIFTIVILAVYLLVIIGLIIAFAIR